MASASGSGISASLPVGQAAQVVLHRLGRVALLDVEADAGFRVPALGQLAAAAAVLLHQRGDVRVADPGEAERVEQLEVQRHRGDPLLAPDDQADPHQVVVDRVREMVRRQAQRLVAALQDDGVVAVVVGGDLAADRVGVGDPGRGCPASGTGPRTGHRPRAVRDLLRGGVPPDRPRPVVAGQRAGRPLPGADVLQLGLGREAQVRLALAEQFAHVGQVDLLRGWTARTGRTARSGRLPAG